MFHPPCRSLCVCVCAQLSPALSRSLLEVSTGPGRCCQTSHCGSSPPLGVVLSQILAPRLIPAFPRSVGGCFCLFFSSFPRADLGAAPRPVSTELQVKGTGLFWPSVGQRLVFDYPSDFSLMAPEQTGSAHPPAIPLTAILLKRRLEFRRGRNSASLSRMSVPEVVPSAASATTRTWKTVGRLSNLWDAQGQEGPEK